MKLRSSYLAGILGLVLVTAACTEKSPKLIPMPDTSRPVQKEDLGEYVPFNPLIDILFVIDDSGSMGQHQTNLSKNIEYFIDGIAQNQILDWQVGVITSSDDNWGSTGNGRLVGNPTIVNKNTANFKDALRRNMLVGTGGSTTEVFFDVVYKALTPPLSTGVNSGFFRPDALLAIVFITDSDTQGNMSAQSLYSELMKLKNNDPRKLTSYSVDVPLTVQDCDRDTYEPVKINDFLKMTNGLEFNLCDPRFGEHLAKISVDVLEKVAMIIPLKQVPVPSTIKVIYGSQTIPNDEFKGWTYDRIRNAIVLGKEIELKKEPKGTNIEVTFAPAILDN